jgi:hypothetical protein
MRGVVEREPVREIGHQRQSIVAGVDRVKIVDTGSLTGVEVQAVCPAVHHPESGHGDVGYSMHDHPGLRTRLNDTVVDGHSPDGRAWAGPTLRHGFAEGGAAHHPDAVAQRTLRAGCPPDVYVTQRDS